MTDLDLHTLKRRAQEVVDNYPDIDAMVADGRLIAKRGWYVAANQEVLDAVSAYATAVEVRRDGTSLLKIPKQTKRSKALRKVP